jgi:hypothetical protein
VDGFESALALVREAVSSVQSPTLYGVGSWFLAGIFSISGVAKLRHPTRAALALVDFGVARRVRRRLGTALGAGEAVLALGLALHIAPTVLLAASSALLWLFVFLVARSLWRGSRFACFCFGETDSRLSVKTLIRTVVLACLATALASRTRNGAGLVGLGDEDVLHASIAISLLGIISLASRLAPLLSWNDERHRARLASE